MIGSTTLRGDVPAVDAPAASSHRSVQSGRAIDGERCALIERADTAFVGSVHPTRGLARATARLRAEDLMVRIEGALVVAAGTDDARVFARTIRDLRETVLAPVSRR